MSDKKVSVEAELTGGSKVRAEAQRINGALRDAKREAGEGVGASIAQATRGAQVLGARVDALASAVTPKAILGGLIGGFMMTSVSQVMAHLSGAADKAQTFGETTSRTARRAGIDLSSLRSTVAKNETATLQSVGAQTDFVTELAKTSFNGKGAAASLRSVGFAATATGRDLSEMVPIVATLQDMGIKGDVGDELHRIGDMAQRLKTIGGPVALQQTLAALRPQLQGMGHLGEGARANIEAFVAALGKKRTPEQAKAVAAQAFDYIRSNHLRIEHSLHNAGLLPRSEHVLNDAGNPRDLIKTTEQLRQLADRKYGKKLTQRKYNAAYGEWAGFGSAMLDDDVLRDTHAQGDDRLTDERLAESFGPVARGKSADQLEVEKMQHEPEGRRRLRELRTEGRERNYGQTALGLREGVYNFADGVVNGQPPGAPALPVGTGGYTATSPSQRAALSAALVGSTEVQAHDQTTGAPVTVHVTAEVVRDPNAFRGN